VLGQGGEALEERDDDKAELRRQRNDGVLVGRTFRWGNWKMAGTMSFRRVMWCWWSKKSERGRSGSSCRRRDRTTAEEELRRARGQTSPVGEKEIGQCDELQGVAVVLMEVWIEGGRLWRRLPMVRPNGGVAWTAAARGRRRPGVI
jgi:hypothetical protein